MTTERCVKSGLRDAREQGFEAAADEAELVVELAVGVFEGVHLVLKALAFGPGGGVLAVQACLRGGVQADQLFEFLFE